MWRAEKMVVNEDALIIGGFRMKLAAVAASVLPAYFAAFPGAQLRECEQNGDVNACTVADVAAAKKIIVYSYGASTLWDLMFSQQPMLLSGKYDALVIIAGVNDVWKGQGPNVWHVPDCFARAICFQINVLEPAPVSHQIHNPEAITIDIDTPAGDARWNSRLLNVVCDSLVAGLDEISKHTTIENHPRVIAAVKWFMAAA